LVGSISQLFGLRLGGGGAFTSVFASSVGVSITEQERTEDAGDVLEDMFDERFPVLTMGKTVDDFTREPEDEIASRAKVAAIKAAD
jgi:hypothetical protein